MSEMIYITSNMNCIALMDFVVCGTCKGKGTTVIQYIREDGQLGEVIKEDCHYCYGIGKVKIETNVKFWDI